MPLTTEVVRGGADRTDGRPSRPRRGRALGGRTRGPARSGRSHHRRCACRDRPPGRGRPGHRL